MYVRGVVPLYPPLSLVGAWITTHEYLRAMVKRGHTVVVTAYLARAGTFQRVYHDGVAIERHFRNIGTPDVIVGHAGDDGSSRAIAERYDVPLVSMVHGGTASVVRERLEGTALAVFNSHSFAGEVGWDGPSIVAHPPVDPANYATTPGDAVTLVNMSEAKGGALFWRIAEAMPTTPFLAVRGGYGDQLMYAGHANVTLQRLTTNMVGDVYGRTRLILMPSYTETWGRVGLEAGASGIPTVARRLPGITEALGDGAIYLDTDDVGEWVAAIGAALEPASWAVLSGRARARAHHFHPETHVNRFVEAVEGVTATRCRIGA